MNPKMIFQAAAIVAAMLVALPVSAERGDDAERVSKNGLTQGNIGDIEVTIEYGRPNVKEREIWGTLVPYDKIWRTGANENSTISFSKAVKIGDSTVKAGTYSVFTIPGKESWTVILNSKTDHWATNGYDSAADVARVKVPAMKAEATEEMTFSLDDDAIVLRWAKLMIMIPVAPAG